MPSSQEKQIIADYIKHLNTLATGSLVLLATFAGKLFERPKWKFLIGVALIGFLSSIVGGVLVYTLNLVTYKVAPGEDIPDAAQTLSSFGISILWIGFLIGVVALATFAVRNL